VPAAPGRGSRRGRGVRFRSPAPEAVLVLPWIERKARAALERAAPQARLTVDGIPRWRDDASIADASDSSGRSRRQLALAGAAIVGAAAVGLCWLFLGAGGNGDVGRAAASLGQAPGIPPPDYAYLDEARVVLYLGQLEGGLAKSDQLTEQLTRSRTAGLTAGRLSLGGSTASSASLERVVTPTATARFYQLLDLLGKDGYLHTIDAAATEKQLVAAFAAVPEGTFVRLENCRLRLPSYVQLETLSRASSGYASASNEYQGAGRMPPRAVAALGAALQAAGRIRAYTIPAASMEGPGVERRLAEAIRALGAAAGRNPRVPISTCDGKIDFRPRGVDLLFPVALADLSSEQSLLAGPVTVVGKLLRAVRRRGDEYVDEASLTTFAGPVLNVDVSAPTDSSGPTLSDELDADAVVLAPGAVILPIAIYK
jgi:hypothetical protein